MAMHGVRNRDKYQRVSFYLLFAQSRSHTNKYHFYCVQILIFVIICLAATLRYTLSEVKDSQLCDTMTSSHMVLLEISKQYLYQDAQFRDMYNTAPATNCVTLMYFIISLICKQVIVRQ